MVVRYCRRMVAIPGADASKKYALSMPDSESATEGRNGQPTVVYTCVTTDDGRERWVGCRSPVGHFCSVLIGLSLERSLVFALKMASASRKSTDFF